MSNKQQNEKITFQKPEIRLRPKKRSQKESAYQNEQKVLTLSPEYASKIERQLNEAIARQQEKEK
jgi:hypothetical protein